PIEVGHNPRPQPESVAFEPAMPFAESPAVPPLVFERTSHRINASSGTNPSRATPGPDWQTHFTWRHIAVLCWITGIVLFVGIGLLRYVTFLRRISACEPATEEWESEWQQVREQMQIGKRVLLVVTKEIGPALVQSPR